MSHNAHDLQLSVRAANIMKRVGAATVGDLVRFTEDEILSAKCFGETSLLEIKEELAKRGLRLGMPLEELQGRKDLDGKFVPKGQAAAEPEEEGDCGGECRVAARKLRERTQPPVVQLSREKPIQTLGDLVRVENEGNVHTSELARKLNMSLAELELSVRATNCLESEGIATVRDLVIRNEEELLENPDFGERALREVISKLEAHGLALGTRFPLREEHGEPVQEPGQRT
jgi:DNA-directed RNA polymerase alpha subunit